MEEALQEMPAQASSHEHPFESAAAQYSSRSHKSSVKSFPSLPTLQFLATADKSKQFQAADGHKEQEETAAVCKRKHSITTARPRLTGECRSVSLTSLDNILIQLEEVMKSEPRSDDPQEPLPASSSNANSLDPAVTIVQIHTQDNSGQGKDEY